MNVSITIHDAQDAAAAAVLCYSLASMWARVDDTSRPAIMDDAPATIEQATEVIAAAPSVQSEAPVTVAETKPKRGAGRPRKETVVALAAAEPAAAEASTAAPSIIVPAAEPAAPVVLPEASVEDLRKMVADLYHADGKGLLWLTTRVLGNGKYKCLSDVPEDHLRAVLAAG